MTTKTQKRLEKSAEVKTAPPAPDWSKMPRELEGLDEARKELTQESLDRLKSPPGENVPR